MTAVASTHDPALRYARGGMGMGYDPALRARALALRLDHDMSLGDVARTLGVSHGAVGAWLRGIGQTRYIYTCKDEACGEAYFAYSTNAQYCSARCQHRAYKRRKREARRRAASQEQESNGADPGTH